MSAGPDLLFRGTAVTCLRRGSPKAQRSRTLPVARVQAAKQKLPTTQQFPSYTQQSGLRPTNSATCSRLPDSQSINGSKPPSGHPHRRHVRQRLLSTKAIKQPLVQDGSKPQKLPGYGGGKLSVYVYDTLCLPCSHTLHKHLPWITVRDGLQLEPSVQTITAMLTYILFIHPADL